MRPLPRPSPVFRAPLGVSLFEVLAVAAVLGVIAAVAVPSMWESGAEARDARLKATVVQLNQRLGVYYANGGSVSGLREPQQIIDQLKNRPGSDATARLSGYPGAIVDSRLHVIALPASQVNTSRLRAIWNASLRRFEVTREAVPGIALFSLKTPEEASETKSDPEEGAARADGAPLRVTPEAAGSNLERQAAVPALAAGPKPQGRGVACLAPPVFSRPTGIYPVSGFPLMLTLSNPNPPGSSRLCYRLGTAGDFIPYAGESLAIAPGDRVFAVAESTDDLSYLDSDPVGGLYEGQPIELQLRLQADWSSFSYFDLSDGLGRATAWVANLEQVPSSLREGVRIRWALGGSDPSAAPGGTELNGQSIPLELACWGQESSITIAAVATAAGPYLKSSATVNLPVAAAPLSLGAPVIEVIPVAPGLSEISIELSGRVPDGCRIYYRTDGQEPVLDEASGEISGTLYEGPFPLLLAAVAAAGEGTAFVPAKLLARVFPPPSLAAWFASSSLSEVAIRGDGREVDAACLTRAVAGEAGGELDPRSLHARYPGINPLAVNRFDFAVRTWMRQSDAIRALQARSAVDVDRIEIGGPTDRSVSPEPWFGRWGTSANGGEEVAPESGSARSFSFPSGAEERGLRHGMAEPGGRVSDESGCN